MSGAVSSFFAADHKRLEALLERACRNVDNIDEASYEEFRTGLLKHIGMEEKILLPALKRLQGGIPYQYADRLHLEHGAFAALLVPPASRKIVAVLNTIMHHHNELEERAGGLYDECERLIGKHLQEVMSQVMGFPEVPVMPHVPTSQVLDVTRRAIARAGYDFDKIES